jgi:GT2 family glycosyltransferase
LVRRDEFLEIGGFDERYFLYGEDIDLSATYAQAALPVTRTSAIAVEHEGGGSSDVPVVNLTVWSELSLLEFTAKWSGEDRAVQAARLVLRSLNTIARLGYLFSRTPIVGRRVQRVGLRASLIRSELAAIPLRDPVTFPWYPLARRALSVVSVPTERDSS